MQVQYLVSLQDLEIKQTNQTLLSKQSIENLQIVKYNYFYICFYFTFKIVYFFQSLCFISYLSFIFYQLYENYLLFFIACEKKVLNFGCVKTVYYLNYIFFLLTEQKIIRSFSNQLMTQNSIKCFQINNENKPNEELSFLKLKHSTSFQTTCDGYSSENMSFNEYISSSSFSILSVSDIQRNEPDSEAKKKNYQHQNGYNLFQNYQLIQAVGQGTFGTVYRSIYLPLSKEVAVKIINFNQFQTDYRDQIIKLYKNEVQILKNIQQKSSFKFHCHFYGSFQHEGCGYLIMQLLQGFSLQELIQSQIQLTLQEQKYYLASILLALQQLHDMGCLHRDIKPQNFMISSKGELYLLDFGCAKLMQKDQRTCTITGTCEYFSPSRFKGLYGNQADIWSFAVTAYELATKKLPFYYQGMENSQQQQKYFRLSSILKSQKTVSLIQLDDHNPEFKKMIQDVFNSILEPKPKLFDIDSVKNSLYFQNFNWVSLNKNQLIPPRSYSLKDINKIRQNTEISYSDF